MEAGPSSYQPSTSLSDLEKVLGSEGRDLVEGIKPTRESMFLLSEKIRRDNKRSGAGARSILNTEKIDLMTDRVIDHFNSWAEADPQKLYQLYERKVIHTSVFLTKIYFLRLGMGVFLKFIFLSCHSLILRLG